MRTRVEQKITIEQLEADITAAGDGADALMCIRECLDASGINSSIDAAIVSDTGLTNLTAAMAGDISVYNDNAGQTFSLKTATGSSDVTLEA